MAKKTSLTNLLLFALEKFVEGGEVVVGSANELREWMYQVYSDYPKLIKEESLSQAIRRLRQRGLIDQEQKRVGEIIYRLTQKGKEEILFKKEEVDNWDGRWRIVIFDIPESKRLVRDVLRSRLKSWGFAQWQKSVWASKKNVTKKLREFINELEIKDWVLVIESDNVSL